MKTNSELLRVVFWSICSRLTLFNVGLNFKRLVIKSLRRQRKAANAAKACSHKRELVVCAVKNLNRASGVRKGLIFNVSNFNLALFIALLCLFSGCHLGPNYKVPSTVVPVVWKAPADDVAPPDVCFWWQIFEDETLNLLEERAIENNPTLYTALERVVQARALAGVSRADLFPQLTLDPSYSNTEFLTKFQGPNIIPGAPAQSQLFRLHQINYSLPLDLSYQLDLWGTYRGQFNSAVYAAQAQGAAYYVALLTLTTDLGAAYFQLRALDAQIDLLEGTKKVRKEAYEVNQARWDAGLVNYTDVTRAALEYTNAEAQFFDAKRLRDIQENQIALLTGEPASLFLLCHNALEAPPPKVPASIPSTVLLNRPDIAQAERELASEQALIGVAYAAFFPQISLTGALGFSSPDLRSFLTWKSRLWAYGANIGQSIFDGGRNLSNLDAAWAVFNEASGAYQNQVLIAFREVEDALSSIEWQTLQYESLQKSVESAKLTTVLSSDRYNRGLVNYLDVVDSERAELEVEITAINLLGERYLSTIQLIKAIGGSW